MELNIEKLGLNGLDEKRPLVIAGPCSAESEEQVMNTAIALAGKGVKIFRAGVWKPRTKPGGFEGHGEPALPWLKRVKEETGMLVTTEVATPKHVEAALEAGVDMLWIGARTTANPFAIQELADSLRGVDVPVLVKFFGLKDLPKEQYHVTGDSSYLALSSLIGKTVATNFFSQRAGAVSIEELTRDLPETNVVSENGQSVVLRYKGKDYIRMNNDQWRPYAH